MYLLFSGYYYYPCGGWNDFVGAFPSIEAAKDHLLKSGKRFDWWHVVCGTEIVANGDKTFT